MAAPEKEGKVQVTLPEGMTLEAFNKAFASFQTSRVATQVRDKAVRSAMKDLIAAHKPEYDVLVKKYSPK